MAKEIFDKVEAIIVEIQAAQPEGAEAIEQFRIKYLGTKKHHQTLDGGDTQYS